MTDKKSFIIYIDYRQHLELLEPEEQGRLLMAMFDYAESGVLPKFEGGLKMAFSFIKAQMDRDKEKYQETCRRRAEAGRKSGKARRAKAESESAEQTGTKRTNVNFVQQNEQTGTKRTDTDTDNDTDNDIYSISKPDKPSKPQKHKRGEYNNVLLTDDEYQKLKTEYPDIEERIERLSEYIASTGKKYKSHYATIRAWARKEKPVEKKSETKFDYKAFMERHKSEEVSINDMDEDDYF